MTLTGQGEETDHNAVGAAVNTISSNLPEMAKGVKMLAALMDDEGANGDDLVRKKQLEFKELGNVVHVKHLFLDACC